MTLKFPIYLDNQATTPLDPRVLEAMMPYLTEKFGNPHSTTHRHGFEGSAAIEAAREQIAGLINAEPREVTFTSGATESNNLAIKGIAETFRGKSCDIITVRTEHKCVLESALVAERWGANILYVPVRPDGLVDLKRLAAMLSERARLVTIMAVNNEIGVIQPLKEIGEICTAANVPFHCDAAQAAGKTPLDVKKMKIGMMSLSAHKIYGPKGVGAIYVRRDLRRLLQPFMSGGGQEGALRSGTLSPALCAGFGRAAEIARKEMKKESARIEKMGRKFWRALKKGIPGIKLNGSKTHRWWGNLNVTFPGIDGDLLISDLRKIAVSSGAACASALEGPSYVLEALGVPETHAKSTLRIGLGRFTTDEEARFAADYIVERVRKLKRR